jgi:hypothetical protein
MTQNRGRRETYSIVAWCVAAVAFLYLVYNIYEFIKALHNHDPMATCVLLNNQLALWILPNAAFGLFILILILHHFSKSDLTFEGPGFKFSGATGPVLLWLLGFAVVGLVMRHAWYPMPLPKECLELPIFQK